MPAAINSVNVAYDVADTRPWWKKLLLSSALTVGLLILLAAMLLILIYEQRWFAGLWLGAVAARRRVRTAVGAILWLLASLGLQAYLRHFGHYAFAYGSIGAFIVLLMWLYLSSMAFVVGAEVNSSLDMPTGNPS